MAGLAPLNDDIAGYQVPGMANAIDDEPLDFDIILHAGPPDQDQAAVQNVGFLAQINPPALEVVQEGFEHDVDPMQQGPGGADALQIDFGHQGHAEEADIFHDIELPQHPFPGFPGDWLVASNAIQQVISFLRDDHPVYATPPAGPGQAMALHAALTQYMIAHGLPFNPPAHPIAQPQDAPPLNGFVGLVGLDDVDEGAEHGPDVQEDEFAGFGEPLEEDDIVWDAQVGQAHQVVEEVGDGPALLLQPVPLPDVEPVLQPALVLGHDHDPIPAPAQVVAAVAHDGVGDGHMNQPEDPPPAYDAPGAAPVEGGDGEADEPEHDAVVEDIDPVGEQAPPVAPAQDVQDPAHPAEEPARSNPEVALDNVHSLPSAAHRAVGNASIDDIPDGSYVAVHLDVDGRTALSSLCARFQQPESTRGINSALMDALNRITYLESRQDVQPLVAESSGAESTRQPAKHEKAHRTHKLRDVWRRTFSRSTFSPKVMST
ncbi:hypothetical protein PENSPDRAFT_738644 [Peniophora sp. CONT]|nr:hypothetical protein PENSPDRAFT_738644 [Peniophora sp. CONT]